MFGQYKRITDQFTGVLTGKGLRIWRLADPARGDRLWRGLFPREHAQDQGPGPGRQARRHLRLGQRRHPCGGEDRPAGRQGADPVRQPRASSTIPTASTQEKIDWVKAHKTQRRGRISEYADEYKNATFHAGKTPWGVECDVALPCATQNELLGEDATHAGHERLHRGLRRRQHADRPRGRARLQGREAALRAGQGGATPAASPSPGLEMSQNSERRSWKEDELQQLLRDIMDGIHAALPRIWRPRRRLYRLCEGRQHRRLQEGRRRDAGLRGGVGQGDSYFSARRHRSGCAARSTVPIQR